MQIRTVLILTLILLVIGLKAQETARLNSRELPAVVERLNLEKDHSGITPVEHYTFTFYKPDKDRLSLPVRTSVKVAWGDEVAKYYALFESVYTYEEQPVAGDPNVVVRIRKPRIYKSIKGIESYLRKELKKDKRSIDSVSQQMIKILKIGIAAISEESKWLEKELKNQKGKKEQIAFYNRIVLKII